MKFLAVVLFLLSSFGYAAELTPGPMVLLQPDARMQSMGLDVKRFGEYILAGQTAVELAIKPARLAPTSGFIVYAVREGGLSNVWLDFQPPLPPKLETKIVKSLRAMTPFPVAKGTLLFAEKVMINGAAEPVGHVPNPVAWRALMASRSETMELEAMVRLVWP